MPAKVFPVSPPATAPIAAPGIVPAGPPSAIPMPAPMAPRNGSFARGVATDGAIRMAPMFPEIGDYALIGNCRTAALVSNRGAVEWLCVPHFSGPPVFGAILDRDAGHLSIRPVDDCRVSRRYLPGTNVLETTFHCDSGVLRLTDCL